mgnify:CR=1 FL=1
MLFRSEIPATRSASGKSETGRLSLSAVHQGGNIVIEVSDDGGGLNRERILAKARENGLTAPDSMSDAEVWQLIFAPGFSTAEVVTDVSGRGVGMDVLKRNIDRLGGRIDINSAVGSGTTLRIILTTEAPLMSVQVFRSGDKHYALGAGAVVAAVLLATKSLSFKDRSSFFLAKSFADICGFPFAASGSPTPRNARRIALALDVSRVSVEV